MSRIRRQHTPSEPAHQDVGVPVVLPRVVMDVAGDGTLTVAVDGRPHEPEPFAPRWGRRDFATILDRLTDQRRVPVRVEVHEADGTVFTDIITPGKRRRPEADTEPPPEEAQAAQPAAELVMLHGDGFVPGEDVAVAIILAHADAAGDGTVRGLLTPAQLADSPTREVILYGRVSGTLTIGHPR
jgi:hypothetical protein